MYHGSCGFSKGGSEKAGAASWLLSGNYHVAEDFPTPVGLLLPNSQIFVDKPIAAIELGFRLAPFVYEIALLTPSPRLNCSRAGLSARREFSFHVLFDGYSSLNALSRRSAVYGVVGIG